MVAKIFAAVIFGAVSLAAEIYIVYGGSRFFSELISSNYEYVQKSGPWLILVVALYVVTKLIFFYLSAIFSFGLAHRLAVLVYTAMCSRDFWDIRSRHSSDYIALAQKANVIAGGFVTQLLNLAISIVGILALMIVLIVEVPIFGTVGFLALGLIYGVVLLLLDQKVKSWSEEISEKTNAVFKMVEDTFQGFRELKLEGLFKKSIAGYSDIEASLKSRQSRLMILASVPKTLLEGIGIVFLIVFVLFGLTKGNFAPQVLDSVLILALGAQRMLPHIQQAYSSFVNANGAHANAKSLLFELDEVDQSIQANGQYSYISKDLPNDGNSIQFLDVKVNFTHKTEQHTILNLPNLKINRGM